MIRISRGAEPTTLTRAATTRLSVAAERFNLHGAPSDELKRKLTGYNARSTKQALFLAQKQKCAWCERLTDFSSAPVEHYRPKDGAWRNLPHEPRKVDGGHYWWLSWTWSNLLFSCMRCNDQAHKANYFPLKSGTVAASPPAAPLSVPPPVPISAVSGEQPLLLDPAGGLDPLDHIEWRPTKMSFDRRDWTWTPLGLTVEGSATVAILKLDELADRLQGHVRTRLLPSIEEVEAHVAKRRRPAARQRWKKLLENNLVPEAEFSAFTWYALGHLVREDYRILHGLAALERPGAR
ncbi:HNH endonuclease [Corallococcus exiguus]|uniref:HNH endonuclease n=1 Tax=Corallococcus exiguus TaxID=83462 RepID=UPI003DA3BBB1